MDVKSKDLFPAIFSRHAAAYQQRLDEIMARGEARGRQRVLELLAAKPGMRVLDLACGPGTLSRPSRPGSHPMVRYSESTWRRGWSSSPARPASPMRPSR